MWVVSEQGFYSVVIDSERAGFVLVRARREEDLRRLSIPGGRRKIAKTPLADYPFRIRLLKRDWATAVRRMAAKIDYPNFKSKIAEAGDASRDKAYANVWADLMAIERERKE